MMMKHIDTEIMRAGSTAMAERIAATKSLPEVLPIYMSSVFSFDDVPTLDDVYEGRAEGYVYGRMANPSLDAAQDVLAAAEGCDGALVFSSGMAAIITAILSYVGAGDHIVAGSVLYGETYQFLAEEAPRLGIEVSFVDLEKDDPDPYFKANTKLFYSETIVNPLMSVTDIAKCAAIAHRHDCRLIIDNTFATPILCRPLELGADIVIYSATKYLCGHSDITAGAICADSESILHIRHFAELYGNYLSPFDSWLLARSLRTLDMRVRKHCTNAQKLAEFLEKQPQISRVYYCGLPSSPSYALGHKQFTDGLCSGMMSIDVIGGEQGASALIAALGHIKFVPSLACVMTTISYPAKTSHRMLSPMERQKAGISMGMLRISTGLEDSDDIIDEFSQALKVIR